MAFSDSRWNYFQPLAFGAQGLQRFVVWSSEDITIKDNPLLSTLNINYEWRYCLHIPSFINIWRPIVFGLSVKVQRRWHGGNLKLGVTYVSRLGRVKITFSKICCSLLMLAPYDVKLYIRPWASIPAYRGSIAALDVTSKFPIPLKMIFPKYSQHIENWRQKSKLTLFLKLVLPKAYLLPHQRTLKLC